MTKGYAMTLKAAVGLTFDGVSSVFLPEYCLAFFMTRSE